MRSLAIIERDRSFARRIGHAFETEGYDVEWFGAAAQALKVLRSRTFDLLVIDADRSGPELCRRIRSEALRNDVPIIAITNDASIHTETLLAGADESVIRSLNMRELLARARAVSRRAANGLSETAAYSSSDLKIYPDTMRVVRNGEQIDLSKGESDVLSLLIRHAPASLSVERIRTELSTAGKSLSRSGIEARLKGLRRKLGPDRIRNRVGFGYSFDGSDE